MDGFQIKSRRSFIKNTAAGLAGLSLSGSSALAGSDEIRVTVLHTNDVHSHIDPFPENHSGYPGQGGAAIRSAIINQIRRETEHVLLLDAGDIFQGTPYFNMYGGELDLKIMTMMGYDAATMGNHDFDNGVAGFVKQLPHAKFPFLCANYDFTNTMLNGKTQPYKIFNKGGVKIGVFGLGIELKGLVNDKLFGETKYIDPIATANKVAGYLKHKKKCDLVICLSHLGFEYKNNKISDLLISKQTSDIDLIIGGHTHTFMDAPATEINSDKKEVIITQAGWAGLRLGRIDYLFERRKKSKSTVLFSMKEMRKSSPN